MRSAIILFSVLAVYHFAQGRGQTSPCSGSCNCKFTNNIESLRTLISDEVETHVEQEVAERLANMSNSNVESLRTLIRDEVETQVEQKVVERLANMSNNNVESLRALVRDEFETQVEQDLQVAKRLANISRGVIYTRWGKSSCPSIDGTQLVYAGRASGSAHRSSGGGGGEILCLPLNPDYIDNPRASSASFYSVLHGGEYDTRNGPHNDLEDHNVACAVCLASTRAAMTMVPAKTQCPTSWAREYYGYLMAERENGAEFAQSSYTCVDVTPDTIAGEAANAFSATTHFTYVIAACNDGIPCPEYEANRVLSCAVCTK